MTSITMNAYLRVSMILCLVSGLSLSYGQASSRSGNGNSVHIEVKMADSCYGDTLRLFLFGKFISPDRTHAEPDNMTIAIIDKKGIGRFDLKGLKALTYFTLSGEKGRDTSHAKYVPILHQYLAEPGDNISMQVSWDPSYHADQHTVNTSDRGRIPEIVWREWTRYVRQFKFSFDGTGAAKYQMRADLDKMEDTLYDETLWDKDNRLLPSKKIAAGMKLMAPYKDRVSPFAYQVIQADLVGEVEKQRLRLTWSSSVTPAMKAEALKVPVNIFPDPVMAFSKIYTDFLADYYAQKYPNDVLKDSEGAYYRIKNDYKPGEVRDRVMVLYLLQKFTYLRSEILEDATQSVQTPFYLEEAKDLYRSYAKGRPAYNFELPDDKGDAIRLAELKGKVVFMDFWYTGCGGCSMYYKLVISKAEEHFRNDTNVVFLSVSIDRDWKKWMRGIHSGRYTSDDIRNVHNLYTDAEGSFHPMIQQYRVFSYPQPLLIDRKGKVFCSNNTELRSNGPEGLIGKIEEALAAN